MNMILKKRLADRDVARNGGVVIHRRTGFTLVEVIVVLVILAILAAIAIPALTGYIDKAEDKKYIADARNAAAAMRAVIGEAYADGKLSVGFPQNVSGINNMTYEYFVTEGNGGTTYPNIKYFNPFRLSYVNNSGDGDKYAREAAKLMGTGFSELIEAGSWNLHFFAPKSPSSYTMFNAPAFMYMYYPTGSAPNKDVVVVTYGLDGINPEAISTQAEFDAAQTGPMYCNPSAGYKVIHYKIN
jgi:prepilin-type N-terminal cleavage/methylation domain-containing protein